MELKYKIIIGLVLAYLAIVLFMYIFQRTFLYFPHEDNYLTEEKILGSPQIVYIPTEDDITLYSWYYSSDSNSKTIVFFHGNAGTLNSRIYKLVGTTGSPQRMVSTKMLDQQLNGWLKRV